MKVCLIQIHGGRPVEEVREFRDIDKAVIYLMELRKSREAEWLLSKKGATFQAWTHMYEATAEGDTDGWYCIVRPVTRTGTGR